MTRRTSTAVLEARGAFQKHPERARHPAPVSLLPLGAPPAHFDQIHAKTWHDLSGAIPLGLATGADRLSLELLCRVCVHVREPGPVKASV
jgi:hypothetical protein